MAHTPTHRTYPTNTSFRTTDPDAQGLGVYTSPVALARSGVQPYVSGTPEMRAARDYERFQNALANLPAPRPISAGGGLTEQQRLAQQAIGTLRGRLAGPSQYDALGAQLADIYGQAERRIREAGAELSAGLQQPVAARQYQPAMTVNPAAMTSYLNAIGANTADVAAQQQLSNALLQQISSGAEQYGQGMTQANEMVRQAMAGAVPANQLAGITQASLNRAALEAQIAAQRAQERKTIEDQILEMALKYGVNYQ